VTALAFSPDARFLASSGEEGAVRVFVANLDGLVALAHERVTRSLTAEECRQYLQASKCPELP
jgi:hypothetical protein